MRDTSLADWLADGDDDDLPAGLDHPQVTEPPAPPPSSGQRPSRRLWLVAAVAWALVIAAGVTVATGPAPEGGAVARPLGPMAPEGIEADPGAADRRAVGEADTAAAGATDLAMDSRGGGSGGGVTDRAGAAGDPARTATPAVWAARDADVAAAAAVAVRLVHTRHDEQAGTSRYVDLALPSAVSWFGDLAVVTVEAVVLDGDGQGWGSPSQVRYAQPMRLAAAGPEPAGDGWTLARPHAASAPAASEEPAGPLVRAPEAVQDPALAEAVVAALARAGYADIAVDGVAVADEAPGILFVAVEALAPGELGATRHDIWLSQGPPVRVLGSDSAAPTSPPHEGIP